MELNLRTGVKLERNLLVSTRSRRQHNEATFPNVMLSTEAEFVQ